MEKRKKKGEWRQTNRQTERDRQTDRRQTGRQAGRQAVSYMQRLRVEPKQAQGKLNLCPPKDLMLHTPSEWITFYSVRNPTLSSH